MLPKPTASMLTIVPHLKYYMSNDVAVWVCKSGKDLTCPNRRTKKMNSGKLTFPSRVSD